MKFTNREFFGILNNNVKLNLNNNVEGMKFMDIYFSGNKLKI